jgi:hypothetical protein
LAIVYGASHESVKDRFLTKIAEISSDQRLPLMLGGDFNIRFSFEKNKDFNSNRHNDLFNLVINLYELRELVMTGGLYKWSNKHKIPIVV